MQGVFAATFAKFIEFEAVGVVPPIFFTGVVPLLAIGASEVDHHTHVFFSHRVFVLSAILCVVGGVSRPTTPTNLVG
jgi:hypothetical membrane protein